MDEHLELLVKYKFQKRLEKLNKKLKNKKILIYGTGMFFKKIKNNYDLSNLNIVAVSDKKYALNEKGSLDMGYEIVPFDDIVEYNPDYILIATLNVFEIFTCLKKITKGTKIKVAPLVDKPFWDLLKEIFV